MTVGQLIETLQGYDPSLMVIVSGHCGRVNEAEHAGQVKIKLNTFTEWYYGKHEVADYDDLPFDCEAIYIH